MLAAYQREVIEHLEDFTVNRERPVGAVAERRQAVAQSADCWHAPRRGIGHRYRQPHLFHNISYAREFLSDVIEERVEPETEFIYFVGRQHTCVRDHHLLGASVERGSALPDGGGYRVLAGPTEAAEPLRGAAFGEVDALRKLIFVSRIGQSRLIVVIQLRCVYVRLRPEL